MRYDIAHELRMAYSVPVWEHHVEVRLTPHHNAHQRVLAAELEIDPDCALHRYEDCFGNRVHYGCIIAPHDHLAVCMRARIETCLENPFHYAAIPPAREHEWVAQTLRAQPRLWDFVLHRSPATPELSTVSVPDLVFPSRDPSIPLLDAIMAALEWMEGTMEYTPGYTYAPARLEEALTRRSGCSQDLAHLLIGIVRSWGFPARYALGYRDPGYLEDDEEAQRPHAWAEVLIPGAGWRGVDPTTRLVANATYVTVAVGRDAADAGPIKSVCKGGQPREGMESETAVVLEVTRDQ